MSIKLYDDDALAYRARASARSPGLASQAGRAWAELERVIEHGRTRRRSPPGPATAGTGRGKKVVIVRAIAQPQVDLKRLARILAEAAIYTERRKN